MSASRGESSLRPPLGQFVDQLIEIAKFAHQRVFDILDAHTADDASDQRPRRIEFWRSREEVFEGRLPSSSACV